MIKHILSWKPVICKSRNGTTVSVALPALVAHQYGGTLLANILAMPTKNPISFAAAVNIICDKQKEAFAAGQIGSDAGQYFWYLRNFIMYISDLGYHIEISGDEFEAIIPSDKLI